MPAWMKHRWEPRLPGEISITSDMQMTPLFPYTTLFRSADFIFLGSKITADGDCNHEIKRLLLLRRKAMTKLDSMS